MVISFFCADFLLTHCRIMSRKELLGGALSWKYCHFVTYLGPGIKPPCSINVPAKWKTLVCWKDQIDIAKYLSELLYIFHIGSVPHTWTNWNVFGVISSVVSARGNLSLLVKTRMLNTLLTLPLNPCLQCLLNRLRKLINYSKSLWMMTFDFTVQID